MADGTKKPIEDIDVGDLVIATDPETGEQAAKAVEHVFVHDDTVIDLIVDGEVITTTEDHPFWSVTDQRFERADHLATGEQVLRANGTTATITELDTTTRHALAYNLSIEHIHTYHVGNNEILVHNMCSIAGEGAAQAGPPRDALGRFTSGAGGESSATVTGRSAHVNYSNTLGGGDYVLNRAIPGTRLRPDAVDYSQNIVRELKPDNPDAIAHGWRQVNGYKEILEKQTGQPWTAYVDVYKP